MTCIEGIQHRGRNSAGGGSRGQNSAGGGSTGRNSAGGGSMGCGLSLNLYT